MNINDISTTVMNRSGQHFTLIDGTTLEWLCMIDLNGAITENSDDCVLAIIPTLSGLLTGLDTRLFYEKPNVAVMCPTCGDLECAGFNRMGRFFRLEDNSILKFVATLDAKCAMDDSNNYVVAVYKLPDGLLRAVDVRALDAYPELHETLQ